MCGLQPLGVGWGGGWGLGWGGVEIDSLQEGLEINKNAIGAGADVLRNFYRWFYRSALFPAFRRSHKLSWFDKFETPSHACWKREGVQ